MENNSRKVRNYYKMNVKFSLSLIKHHTKKKCGAVKIYFHAHLILALDGSDWSASRPGPFIAGPLARRLGGTQNRNGSGRKEKAVCC
jgi:hypothetical protein